MDKIIFDRIMDYSEIYDRINIASCCKLFSTLEKQNKNVGGLFYEEKMAHKTELRDFYEEWSERYFYYITEKINYKITQIFTDHDSTYSFIYTCNKDKNQEYDIYVFTKMNYLVEFYFNSIKGLEIYIDDKYYFSFGFKKILNRDDEIKYENIDINKNEHGFFLTRIFKIIKLFLGVIKNIKANYYFSLENDKIKSIFQIT